MISALVALAVASLPQVDPGVYLLDPKAARIGLIRPVEDRVKVTKESPKLFGDPARPWMFEWLTAGYGNLGTEATPNFTLRFEVYSQERRQENDRAPKVARMLLRLWDYNRKSLLLDHSSEYNLGIVTAYLCWGGQAGGEQMFAADPQIKNRKVNTIYFYDLASFTDPVEMAREIAHEYGHATLPAIGGFTEPEDWANGYLGERLFLRRLSDGISKGEFTPADAMDAPAEKLKAWVAANVDPLAVRAATEGPNLERLGGSSKDAMDAYMGLALYANLIFPERVFARSLVLTGSTSAKDYVEAIQLAAEEPDQLTIKVPPLLQGKAIWLPVGAGRLFGAKVLQRRGAWVKVQPAAGPVVIFPKRES